MFHDPYAYAMDESVGIALLAEFQVQRAIARGEFNDLPLSGKPLDLPAQHDPDWWLKSLIKREGLALLPSSIQLRKDDAALDDVLDGFFREADVRRELETFNRRVIRARYELPAGPPLITMPRDVDAAVGAWAQRRAARLAAARVRTRGEQPPRRRRQLRRRRLSDAEG